MAKKSKRTNKRKVSKRHYRKKNKKTRKIHKRKMMKGGADKGVAKDQSKLIQDFVKLTGVDPEEAFERISTARGDIRVAMDNYFSEMAQQGTDAKMARLLSDGELARKLAMEDRGYGGATGAPWGPGGAAKAARASWGPGGAAKAARAPAGAAQLFLDNRNMLEVSYEQHNSGEIVGYLIAGNAGIVGGGLMDKSRKPGATPHWNIDCRDKKQIKPQEEGSFINFCCATRDYNSGNRYFFDLMKAADRVWGMTNLTGTDNSTKQGVDYTDSSIGFKLKYERCIYVGMLSGYSQKGLGKTLEEWNTRESSPCKVFITAGPQARNPDTEFRSRLSSTSTMRRTYDHNANIDDDYLINSIRAAYIGSLKEMDSQGVTVAIVPGLSTGVYAPPSKKSLILSEIPEIINAAISYVSPKNIKKVIYCNPSNPRKTGATKASRATGATDVPRQIMDKLNKFKSQYSTTHGDALNEIKEGQKKSCWSWWIWPVSRRDAKDKSPKRKEWSLSKDECKHFILEPGLGDKWVEIMEELFDKLIKGTSLLYLTGNNHRDEEVVKQSCNFFRNCASELDYRIPIVQRVLNVSNNILSKA